MKSSKKTKIKRGGEDPKVGDNYCEGEKGGGERFWSNLGNNTGPQPGGKGEPVMTEWCSGTREASVWSGKTQQFGGGEGQAQENTEGNQRSKGC